ncbi:Gar1/Naf1 RNA binding region-domain-containing protein [Scleroderma citrinum]
MVVQTAANIYRRILFIFYFNRHQTSERQKLFSLPCRSIAITMSRGAPRGAVRGGRGFSRGGGPPDTVLEAGSFLHSVEDEMFCASLIPDKVPYFNAPIYLQNKSVIGKVDEILGPINEVYFSVKMQEGMVASSFQKGDKVYIGSDKLLPIERFLPKPKTIGRGRGGQGVGKRGRGAPTMRGSQRGRGRGRGMTSSRGFGGGFRGGASGRGGGFSRGMGRGGRAR